MIAPSSSRWSRICRLRKGFLSIACVIAIVVGDFWFDNKLRRAKIYVTNARGSIIKHSFEEGIGIDQPGSTRSPIHATNARWRILDRDNTSREFDEINSCCLITKALSLDYHDNVPYIQILDISLGWQNRSLETKSYIDQRLLLHSLHFANSQFCYRIRLSMSFLIAITIWSDSQLPGLFLEEKQLCAVSEPDCESLRLT
jgi:hypothetical protein